MSKPYTLEKRTRLSRNEWKALEAIAAAHPSQTARNLGWTGPLQLSGWAGERDVDLSPNDVEALAELGMVDRADPSLWPVAWVPTEAGYTALQEQ